MTKSKSKKKGKNIYTHSMLENIFTLVKQTKKKLRKSNSFNFLL